MTSLVRLCIKTSFVFLLLGLVLGWVRHRPGEPGRPGSALAAHHRARASPAGGLPLLTLVFGVATWMFLRPPRNDARYRPWLAWLVYWLLAVSTVVRVLGEVGAVVAGTRSSLLTALGGLVQLAAAGVFVFNMWRRVRMPGGVAPQPLVRRA